MTKRRSSQFNFDIDFSAGHNLVERPIYSLAHANFDVTILTVVCFLSKIPLILYLCLPQHHP